MQSAKIEPAPTAGSRKWANSPALEAAAYIHDMTASLRQLALRHNLATLALLLEMAAVEAAMTPKKDQA